MMLNIFSCAFYYLVFSLGKHLLLCLPVFLLGDHFLNVDVESSLYIPDINPLSDRYFAHILFQSVAHLFSLNLKIQQ